MTEPAENQGNAERPERAVLHRKFEAEFTAEGRTLDVRIVPYGVKARVSDGGPYYEEEWAPGAFDEQVQHAGRGDRLKVLLNFEHERGIRNVVGKAVELRSAPDGLHGSFEMLDDHDGNKALGLVTSGILDGVSLEAYARRTMRTAQGVMRRTKGHLVNVALCRTPAFEDARVLAVREDEKGEEFEDEVVLDEMFLPIPVNTDDVERCRRLGIPVPQRYEAHPDVTDTPAETGTSEDGTRPETATTS